MVLWKGFGKQARYESGFRISKERTGIFIVKSNWKKKNRELIYYSA